MIGILRGTLAAKAPTTAVVDVNGVGYDLQVPVSTFEAIGVPGSPVTLYTHLHVREDALVLYGFATTEEREIFRLLIGVSGIGPKMAQGILSGIPVTELREHIAGGNLNALTAIPGVGRKIGERLILELRDKVGKTESMAAAGGTDGQSQARSEAFLALTSLGYSRPAAEKALRSALQEAGPGATIEILVKAALRHASQHQG